MENEKLSINEVISEVKYWLDEEFPNDLSPSEYRKAMEDLDNLGLMDFNEILLNYPNLNSRFVDDFEFSINDPEFETKLDEVITDHVVFLEETCGYIDDNSYETDW